MEKVTNDKGEVAVLVSPGYGAGFHTWNDIPDLCFYPFIVNHLIADTLKDVDYEEIEELIKKDFNIPEEHYVCALGVYDCKIAWLKKGTVFAIEEYDGSESLTLIEDLALTA